MENNEEKLLDIVSIRNHIANNSEIPIEIIKNNLGILENLSETELLSIIFQLSKNPVVSKQS